MPDTVSIRDAVGLASETEQGLLSAADKVKINDLDTMSTQAASAVAITGGTIAGITDLAVADGGTGASSAGAARTNLGLGTAATHNVPASGDAAAGEVVLGNDSRLGGSGTFTVEEVDGTPSVAATKLVFPNGTLGNVSGVVTYTPAGGGGGSTTSSGAYASRPGSGTTAGDLYLATDTPITSRWTGSAWQEFYGSYPLTAIPTMSWVNQTTATTDTTKGGVFLEGGLVSGYSLNLRVESAPATPYTVTALVLPRWSQINGQQEYGIGWRESSSGKLHMLMLATAYSTGTQNLDVYSFKFTSATATSAAYTHSVAPISALRQQWGAPLFLHLKDDGTNRSVGVSADGVHPMYTHTVGRTDFLTPDQIGFFVDSQSTTYRKGAWFLSWAKA